MKYHIGDEENIAEFLPSFPQFDPNPASGDVGPRWRKWVARFQNLMIAVDVSEDERQNAMLLHYIGEETFDIYETLGVAVAGDGEKQVDKAIDVLTSHFAPKMNTEYEVYKFRQARQEAEEDFSHFLTRLRQLAATCGFTDKDREIKTEDPNHSGLHIQQVTTKGNQRTFDYFPETNWDS